MERLLPWLRRSGWAYVAAACALALFAWRVSGGGGGAPSQPSAGVRPHFSSSRGGVARGPGGGDFLVYVAGAVRHPGVYRIGGDGRVIQAVRLAGGPTGGADLTGINLAARVQDGQQVLVPQRLRGAPPGKSGGTGPPTGPVSLSSATAEQLDALDGVGPTLAARIVAWRQAHGGFASVDQLLDVPGIGPGRLAALKDKVVP